MDPCRFCEASIQRDEQGRYQDWIERDGTPHTAERCRLVLKQLCTIYREEYEQSKKQVRPTVMWFALAMEAKLRSKDSERGKDSWRQDTPEILMSRLREEVEELEKLDPSGTMLGAALRVLERPNDPQHRTSIAQSVLQETADIANFAMMIADICSRGMKVEEP